MKVIVTGATGMIGKGVLLECLDHKDITEVLFVGRRSLEMNHPKLKELLHSDFSEFETVKNQLMGYDTCYHCMGVSSANMDESTFTKLTYEFTMALMKVLYANNPQMTIAYVSGQGTDSTEKGKTMWARVKGKTENDIMKMGFKQVFAYRPGAIIPKRGVEPSDKLYKFLVNNLTWLLKGIKMVAPNFVVDTQQIGLSMIHASQKGYSQNIINPKDIIALAK